MTTHLAQDRNVPLDWLILGAGIAGLTLGSRLLTSNQTVQLLDKSRGVGGRLATRRMETALGHVTYFDHGLSVIELFQAASIDVLEQILGGPVLDSWVWSRSQEFGSHALRTLQPLPGVNALAKAFSATSQVQKNQKAVRIDFDATRSLWQVTTEDQKTYEARNLVSTLPLPQFLELIRASGLEAQTSLPATLSHPQYHPGISLLWVLDRPAPFSFLRSPTTSIALVMNNSWKGIAPSQPSITISFAPQSARELFDRTDAELIEFAMHTLPALAALKLTQTQVHRWRYALPAETYAEPYFAMDLKRLPQDKPLYLCGDYFGSPVISPLERAILSADGFFKKQL